MRFVTFDDASQIFRGKSIAIVGSGPSVLCNEPNFVDSHEVVVRVNNHRCSAWAGRRTDVHYSFYGTSIRKTSAELQSEGVTLCMCKCPDAKAIESKWHERNGKIEGVDFRYIYRNRKDWWFCDTYVPDIADFRAKMELLGWYVPTTGFSAILDVLACEPASIYLTGFDFMTSGLHNVTERWKPGDPSDPIGHRPERERAWVTANADKFTFDRKLAELIAQKVAA